jgi:hypothetical protein
MQKQRVKKPYNKPTRRGTSSKKALQVEKKNQEKEQRIDALRIELESNCPDAKIFIRKRITDPNSDAFTTDNTRIEELERQGFVKRINHGFVVIIDWDLEIPVLLVLFNDVPQDQAVFLCKYFRDMHVHSNPITKNGSQLNGTMYATGHRRAYSAEFTAGVYDVKSSTQRSSAKREQFACILTEKQKRVERIYRNRFIKMSPKIYQTMVKVAEKSKVPSFGQLELNTNTDPFASNVTWTINDFFNCLHVDKDANPYAYGIWMTTYNDELVSDTTEEIGCERGYFYLPEYRVFVDFGNNIVEIIWRGREDQHCTTPSKRKPKYQRIGTSIQISQVLADALKKYYNSDPSTRKPYKGLTATLQRYVNKK